jgi:hypothetical protein
MGKYMIAGTYTADGAEGVLKGGGSRRRAAAAAVALVGTASGTLRSRAIVLVTPEEMDKVAQRTVDFRPPSA